MGSEFTQEPHHRGHENPCNPTNGHTTIMLILQLIYHAQFASKRRQRPICKVIWRLSQAIMLLTASTIDKLSNIRTIGARAPTRQAWLQALTRTVRNTI